MHKVFFSKFIPDRSSKNQFEKLLDIFLQLLTYSAGDVAEALKWMNQLDQRHRLTDDAYGMGDFIQDLKDKGFIEEDGEKPGFFKVKPKAGQTIRKRSLDEIFGKLKKFGKGNHRTPFSGMGDETASETRRFTFGDETRNIDATSSLKNAQINHGLDDFMMTEEDLVIREMEAKTLTSTVLMIDISHSMILYGEDRITPAKNVAMALAELITTRYPKDTLDIIVFGNQAWPVEIKDLPYLQVGPFHTNTHAGLELAMDILRRRKTQNKQIFMITDGKPTCIIENGRLYKNSYGLDRKIINKTLNQAARCRRSGIPVTTFMIASDPYLQQFVRDFTKINHGRAFYSDLKGLGEYIFEDYVRNRRKRTR